MTLKVTENQYDNWASCYLFNGILFTFKKEQAHNSL